MTIPSEESPNFTIQNVGTGQSETADGDAYDGPVDGIDRELIVITSDNLNIFPSIPNVFIHTGNGDDTIGVSATGGSNVLDGGGGSNYLTGGPDYDQFYIDNRTPEKDVWSVLRNFGAGDDLTVWGLTPDDFAAVLPNSPGLTIAFDTDNGHSASLTLAGEWTAADLANGKLSVVFGTTDDWNGVAGSDYLRIHAT